MSFLLDTDICSAHVKGNRAVYTRFMSKTKNGKGMVYSPSHGDIAFTVPLFDEFMIRAIHDFPS